jgi:hypothetical protein
LRDSHVEMQKHGNARTTLPLVAAKHEPEEARLCAPNAISTGWIRGAV